MIFRIVATFNARARIRKSTRIQKRFRNDGEAARLYRANYARCAFLRTRRRRRRRKGLIGECTLRYRRLRRRCGLRKGVREENHPLVVATSRFRGVSPRTLTRFSRKRQRRKKKRSDKRAALSERETSGGEFFPAKTPRTMHTLQIHSFFFADQIRGEIVAHRGISRGLSFARLIHTNYSTSHRRRGIPRELDVLL